MNNWIKACWVALMCTALPALAGTLTFDTYYHNDHLGSPVAATDERSDLLWRAHFRPYGERQENPADAAFGNVGYTGHMQDADSGMVYMQARYYDPMIGRFLAVDPVGVMPGVPGSFNRYVYTQNNPYRYKDPDGRWIEDAVVGSVSLSLGVTSLANNIQQGNWGGAALDTAGLGADLLAAAAPGFPAAAGIAIDTARRSSSSLVSSGAEVTPEVIERALQGDAMQTAQKAVSLPAVQNYVDRLLKGEVAPAIKVDGNVIVEGNHRYIAGKVAGSTPEIVPGSLAPNKASSVQPIQEIKVDSNDWGNR